MSSEEAAFLKVLADTPEDETVRGAYADWLDEQSRGEEAAKQRLMAPGHRAIVLHGLQPLLMDWGNSLGVPCPGCEGVWYGWSYPENPHHHYAKSVIPCEQWYEKISLKDEYPENHYRAWCYFRRNAEDVAAIAFSFLPAERQAELLALPMGTCLKG